VCWQRPCEEKCARNSIFFPLDGQPSGSSQVSSKLEGSGANELVLRERSSRLKPKSLSSKERRQGRQSDLSGLHEAGGGGEGANGK
jgi:hypothetical protein